MVKITLDEFAKRLEAICLKKGGRGLPRKHRDQHILFKSIVLILKSDREYSEKELNETLLIWLTDIGRKIEIDHVTLRRHLVDEGYLYRDRAGKSYRVSNNEKVDLFESEINDVDPATLIEKALKNREQKKSQYLNKTNGSSS